MAQADDGVTFDSAQKMGIGTWKLNACPMDGGAVVLTTNSPKPTQPLTVWRRENTLYTCRLGEPEQAVATGRNVTAATSPSGTALAWDEGGTIWLKATDRTPVPLGKGMIPSVAIGKQGVVCVWEDDGQVMMEIVQL